MNTHQATCSVALERWAGVGIVNGADYFPDMSSASDTATTVRELDAALAQLESRLVRWLLAIGAAIVAAVKVIPGF